MMICALTTLNYQHEFYYSGCFTLQSRSDKRSFDSLKVSTLHIRGLLVLEFRKIRDSQSNTNDSHSDCLPPPTACLHYIFAFPLHKRAQSLDFATFRVKMFFGLVGLRHRNLNPPSLLRIFSRLI